MQADFGVDRAAASLSYTACMLGFGLGGVLPVGWSTGWRVCTGVAGGACASGRGFYLAQSATDDLAELTLVNGLLIGVGASATFAPLMADVSQWFVKRRGMAIAICASGNYLAGVVWPMVMQQLLLSR